MTFLHGQATVSGVGVVTNWIVYRGRRVLAKQLVQRPWSFIPSWQRRDR